MKYPDSGWAQLSSLFRESPFMNLDLTDEDDGTVLPIPIDDLTEISQISDVDDVGSGTEPEEETRPRAISQSSSLSSSKSMAAVHHNLKCLHDMSFLLDGQADVLAEFAKGLEKLKTVFQKFVPTENGLSLRPEAPSTWTTKPLQCNPLPKRRKIDRKAQLKKRVGATAERKLKEADITVAIKEETDNKTVIVEEVIQILCLQTLCAFPVTL